MPDEKDKIERLKDDLYRRDPAGTTYTPHDLRREKVDAPQEWAEEEAHVSKKEHTFHTKNHDRFDKWIKIVFAIGALVFLLALGFAAYRFFIGLNVVDSKKIDVAISGPVSIKGGDVLDLDIVVKNNNEIPLESATLIMEYPPGTRSADDIQTELRRSAEPLGALSQGGTIERKQSAVLFGEKDSVHDVVVKIEYRVAGSNATFTKEETYPITITSSPLIMTVAHSDEVNSGQEMDFTITLASNSNRPMEDLLVRAEFPFGFEFRSASPEPRFGDNVWDIGTLEPGTRTTIHVTGRMQGQENEEKTFRFYAGEADASDTRSIGVEFISSQNTLTIRQPFVALSLGLNGNQGRTHTITMGQNTQVNIRWQSNLDSALDDAEIIVRLRGDALNKQRVSVGSGGFYRSIDNTILWSKNNNPALTKINPGDTGSVTFSLATVAPSPATIAEFTNAQIDIDVEMLGRRFTPSGEMAEGVVSNLDGALKVRSDMSLLSRLVYNDGPFENLGPIPPRSETETTYTALWSLTNAFNDVENAEVRASLPSYVEWVGQVDPQNENIEYIEDTREVVWRPGFISAGVGFLEGSRNVAFRIRFLPSQGQIGSTPSLVNNIRATGRDTFTDALLDITRADLTTDIATDSQYERGDGRIVQ